MVSRWILLLVFVFRLCNCWHPVSSFKLLPKENYWTNKKKAEKSRWPCSRGESQIFGTKRRKTSHIETHTGWKKCMRYLLLLDSSFINMILNRKRQRKSITSDWLHTFIRGILNSQCICVSKLKNCRSTRKHFRTNKQKKMNYRSRTREIEEKKVVGRVGVSKSDRIAQPKDWTAQKEMKQNRGKKNNKKCTR